MAQPIQLTPLEQAYMWERMSGERLTDVERRRILDGGDFVRPSGDYISRLLGDIQADPNKSIREDALIAEIERLRSHLASLDYIPLRLRDRPPGFVEARRKICTTPDLCFEFGDVSPMCGPCDTAAVKAIYQTGGSTD